MTDPSTRPTTDALLRPRASVALAARRALRRAVDRLDELAFPEAASAAEHWQRAAMDAAVEAHVATLPVPELRAAEVAGDARGDLGWRSHRSLSHPPFDLLEPVPDDLRFDVVFCEQVLEHVHDPFLAARHLHDLLEPGGHLVVTSPFLVKVHELPMYGMHDYWRFTPRGLRTLLEAAGLEVDHVDGWGNRMCVVGNLRRWARHERWHPMSDEPDIPVQLWAFARRPGG